MRPDDWGKTRRANSSGGGARRPPEHAPKSPGFSSWPGRSHAGTSLWTGQCVELRKSPSPIGPCLIYSVRVRLEQQQINIEELAHHESERLNAKRRLKLMQGVAGPVVMVGTPGGTICQQVPSD